MDRIPKKVSSVGSRAGETPPIPRACGIPPEGCRVVAVIPAYNEERFIGSVVLRARRFVDQVLVVDDGSSDDTAQVARAAGALVVSHTANCGKGAALSTGLHRASELDPDAVVTLDADGQHRPEDIPTLVAPVLGCDPRDGRCEHGNTPPSAGGALPEAYDLVIGSRYLERRSPVPAHRVWGHRVFNLFTHALSGQPASDSQSGFRAFSRRALSALDFSSGGFSVESEMQFLAHELGLRVGEAPVAIHYTDPPKRAVLKHGLLVVAGIFRLVGQYRPLLFFGLPGAFAMLGGLGIGVYVVDIYRRSQQLAVGYAMISVLLTIIGMVGFSTGVILHSVRGLLVEMLNRKNNKN